MLCIRRRPASCGYARLLQCDVIMGVPQGDDLVQATNPYYRTAYALVFKTGSGLDGLDHLSDERLKQKRIGIVAGTPPATTSSANGLMARAKPYPLVIDTRIDSSAAAMMKDLADGEIDVGILLGPMAGYYASRPALATDGRAADQRDKAARDLPFASAWACGVRTRTGSAAQPADPGKSDRRSTSSCSSYGVPLLDEKDQPITESSLAKQCRAIPRLRARGRCWRPDGSIARRGEDAPLSRIDTAAENYRTPTPATLRGARVVTTDEAEAIWKNGNAVFVDVLPRPPRPPNLPAGNASGATSPG